MSETTDAPESAPETPEIDWSAVPGAMVTADQVVEPSITLRPLFLVRTRLQERGLWPAMAALLMGDPEKLLRLLSAEQPGMVDVADPDVIAAIRAVGGDPAEVLA